MAMDQLSGMKERLFRVPSEISYSLLLFISTRIALAAIGVMSKIEYGGVKVNDMSQYVRLGIEGIWSNGWDSGWYYTIAKYGYSTQVNAYGQANYCFFPLYPIAMRLFGLITGDYYLAGIIVSNIALFIACIYLFKIVMLESDKETGLKSIKYLFLFPTAFILSGVMSESLFLALIIICFYYAKKENWPLACTAGFLMALTRSIGLFMVIPLAYMYFRSKHYRIQECKPDALLLVAIPLATLAYFTYLYSLTDDFFAYIHIEQSGWSQHFSNPVVSLVQSVISGDSYQLFNVIFTLACLAFLIFAYKKVDTAYILLGMIAIFVPLSSFGWSIICMSRYTLIIFPIFIILAKLSTNQRADLIMTIVLAMLQGFLMALWVNQSILIV